MEEFDIKKFQSALSKYLESINSDFVFGCDSSLKTSTEISLIVPVVLKNPINENYNYIHLAKAFWWLTIDKILKHLVKRKYNIGDPLLKHANLYYFTPDMSMVETYKDYFLYMPFLKDTVYCTIEKPIANIESYINEINFENNKLILKFPLYL